MHFLDAEELAKDDPLRANIDSHTFINYFIEHTKGLDQEVVAMKVWNLAQKRWEEGRQFGKDKFDKCI